MARVGAYMGGPSDQLKVFGPQVLIRPAALFGMGLSARRNETNFSFRLADGDGFETGLSGGPAPDADSLIRVTDRLGRLPLYLRTPQDAALLAWLPEADAAYVRINRNRAEGLREDLDGILQEIAAGNPRHVIVDLRLNGGGNMLLTADFAEALPTVIPAGGRLAILIGPETFSAGIITAAILKDRAGGEALLLGAPPGDRLTWWSEDRVIRLPNSGLKVLANDGFHDWQNGYLAGDSRYAGNPRQAARNQRYSAAAGSLQPDIPVSLTFADHAQGRDPLLARALKELRL